MLKSFLATTEVSNMDKDQFINNIINMNEEEFNLFLDFVERQTTQEAVNSD